MKLAVRSPGPFLERYAELLSDGEVAYFDALRRRDDEVDHYLSRLEQSRARPAARGGAAGAETGREQGTGVRRGTGGTGG